MAQTFQLQSCASGLIVEFVPSHFQLCFAFDSHIEFLFVECIAFFEPVQFVSRLQGFLLQVDAFLFHLDLFLLIRDQLLFPFILLVLDGADKVGIVECQDCISLIHHSPFLCYDLIYAACFAGVDLDELMGGAQEMMTLCAKNDYSNPAWQYAAMRHELYRQGKKVELLACFEPAFRFMAEWWKQLYGESEGKEEKGLFPASVDFTADLHSMGQYIQQGERMLMETVVRFAPAEHQMRVPFDESNGDGLNFLAGKTMDFINRQAMDGTLLAHVEGGVPNLIVSAGERNARTLGELIYFFEFSCGLSGYLLGVNPFDQPGVEAYKKNMFALLGKPGYEEMGEELRKRLH